MARLFFAVWPDAPAAGRLGALAQSLPAEVGGRAVPQANIHLTLAFLGELGVERAADAAQVAAAVAAEAAAFAMRLDELGAFRKARVAWAGASRAPAALLALQSALEAGLRARGFVLEERPFRAHVTLARKTERVLAPRPITPIEWQATRIALVHSVPGGRYEDVGGWLLR